MQLDLVDRWRLFGVLERVLDVLDAVVGDTNLQSVETRLLDRIRRIAHVLR